MDAAFAAKLVAHVHANMNKWLARGDLWVSGTIDDIDLTRAPAESFLVTFSEDTDSDSDSDAEYVHVVESEDEGDEDAAAGGSGEELELDEEKGEGGEEEERRRPKRTRMLCTVCAGRAMVRLGRARP